MIWLLGPSKNIFISCHSPFNQQIIAAYTFLPGGSGGHGGVKEKMSIVGFLCVAKQKKRNSQQSKGDIQDLMSLYSFTYVLALFVTKSFANRFKNQYFYLPTNVIHKELRCFVDFFKMIDSFWKRLILLKSQLEPTLLTSSHFPCYCRKNDSHKCQVDDKKHKKGRWWIALKTIQF